MGTLFKKRFDTGSVCDVSEDFTLPDYQPEIRRVVGVRARATTDGKYLTGEEFEVDGGVTYTVIYVGADGEVHQASETSSYTGKMPASSENDRFGGADLVLSATCENASCRVSAPRKITLCSRVKLGLMSQRPIPANMKADGEVRSRRESVDTAHITEIRHTSEVEGELREREGMTLVLASGETCISDVRVSGDRATVKGDAYVNLTLRTPEGEYVTSRKSAPIEEEIALHDDLRGEEVRAAAFATPLMLEVESADNGEIGWKMEYDVDLDVMSASQTDVVLDAYLTEAEDDVKFSEVDAYYPASSVNGRLTTSAAVKAREGMRPITAWGSAAVTGCEVSGGRMMLSGQVKLCVLMKGEGEVACEEAVVPLRYECDAYPGAADTDGGAMTCRSSVAVCDVGVRQDGESVHLTAELAIAASALGSRRVKFVSEVAPVGDKKSASSNGCVIRVYAPSEGESAWDVEKHFRLRDTAQSEGEYYII